MDIKKLDVTEHVHTHPPACGNHISDLFFF